MRDFSTETHVNPSVNWLRLAPALLNGHLIPSVRTVMADSANHTAQTLLSAGMRRVAVPQDAGERVDFVAKWVQRNQRRVAAGLPISVLVLALSAAEAQAQEELVSLAAQEGVEGVTILANGDVQVTYTNGNVVVLAENSVVISATGEVLVTVAVAEGAALSAGVALAGGMGAIGAAGLGAAGLLASLSGGEAGGGGSAAPDNGVSGSVIDGYIAGATVFRDLNANRILDAGEPSVTSDAAGNFTGLTGTGGVLVSVGGTDISTGKAFTGIMTAPAGATVVTPLTTLVQAMVEADPTLTAAQASAAVVRAFGIDPIRVDNPGDDGGSSAPPNLLTFDPANGRDGLDVFAAGAKVAAVMMVAAAAAGNTPAEQAAAVRAVALSLAAQIAQNEDTPTNGPLLTQSAILDALNVALDDDDANEDKATLLENILGRIDAASSGNDSNSELLGAIEDVQTYVQGALVDAIDDGTVPDIEDVNAGIDRAVSLRPSVTSIPRVITLSEITLDESLEITGTGRPGSIVTVTFGGLTSDDITVDGEGGWTFTLNPDDLETVIEGTPASTGPFGDAFEMQAVAKETIGTITITSPVTVIGRFTVDLTAPDSPVITDQIAGDNTININEANSAIRVQGTVEAGVQQVEYWINDGQRQSMSVMSTSSGPIFEFSLSANAQNSALALPTADGPFTLNIVSIDAGLNRSEPVEVTLTIDRTPPSMPTLNDVNYGGTINAEMAEGGVEVSGLVSLAALSNQDASDIFRLTFDGVNFIPVVNDGFGNYTATLNADNLPTADGTYTLKAQRIDTAGNISEATQQITLDRTPPAAPQVNPILGDAVNATEDLIVTGTALPGSTVNVSINGEEVGSALTEAGTFSITVSAGSLADLELEDGEITVSITAKDSVGNESTAATTTFTYDGTPPAAATFNDQNLVFGIADTEQGLVFTGAAEANAKVSFQLLTQESNFQTGVDIETTADDEGNFTITFASDNLGSGNFTLRTLVTDAAGNVATQDYPNVVVDRVAPTAPMISAISGDNIINKAKAEASGPLFIFGTAEASTATLTNQVEVRFNGITSLFDVNQSGGYTAPFALSNLPATDGTYDVTAVAIDAAGNRGEEMTRSITIDRTPPAAPMLNNVAELTLLNAAETANGLTISGEVTGATRVVVSFAGTEVGVDVDQVTRAFSASFTAAQLPQMDVGTRIEVTAFDAAGNSSSTVRDVTIDRTPPTAAEITDQSINAEGLLTLTGTLPAEPNAVFSIEMTTSEGTSTFTPTIEGTTFTLTLPSILADGSYSFATRITDAAGNQTVGQNYDIQVGAPPQQTAAEIYATALTLDDMIGAVEALIEEEPTKFAGIEQADHRILAADLLMERRGTYSISFNSEKFDQEGSIIALVTDNETGTDVSGTFHIPVDYINFANDRVTNNFYDTGVFEFSVNLPHPLTNTFTGADGLNLVTGVTNLRLEVVDTDRELLPPDEALRTLLGEAAANKIIAAFAAANGQPIKFTSLIIWAPGDNAAEAEGQPFTGSDLTLVLSQLGDVALDAFFTNPADTFTYVVNAQYTNGENVGAELLNTTSVSVEFDLTQTGDDLGDILLDAAALRTAVADVLEAANSNSLTVELLETLVNTAGANNGEAANALRLLAGEQLEAADVDRLFAFLVQPIVAQTNALADYNNMDKFPAKTLTDVLDDTTLLPPSLLEGTQVFFDADYPAGLVINDTRVDVAGDAREMIGAEGDVIIEMMWLDLTNPDITWQITPAGNVVVAAFIDGPQTVPQDVILVYRRDGFLKAWVTNVGDTAESFYVNDTVAGANGVVFSLIDAATSHSAGSTPFTTYRAPLSAFDGFEGEITTAALAQGSTPLLTFAVPNELAGLDFKPTSAIELLEFSGEYELSRMLIQVETPDGKGVQSVLYTSDLPSPTFEGLPVYVEDYSVVLNGATPVGLLLTAYPTVDVNGPADGGEVTQNSVYYFDLDMGALTAVQTTGTDAGQDVLFGQGSNDIIIPLGVTDSTAEETIYLPVLEIAEVQGRETIVVDLNDVFAGNRLAVYGFDLTEDKIAFFGSDLLTDADYSIRPVTVENAGEFTLSEVLTNTDTTITQPELHFFAVNDGDNTILFVTDGTKSGEVAWLNGVLSGDAAGWTTPLQLSSFAPKDLLVTPFAPDDLLVSLPT